MTCFNVLDQNNEIILQDQPINSTLLIYKISSLKIYRPIYHINIVIQQFVNITQKEIGPFTLAQFLLDNLASDSMTPISTVNNVYRPTYNEHLHNIKKL